MVSWATKINSLTPEAANLLLVNTCGVIQEACQEAVDTILELARHKEADPGKRLAVTGFPRPQAAAWERKFWPKLRLGTLIYLSGGLCPPLSGGHRPPYLAKLELCRKMGSQAAAWEPEKISCRGGSRAALTVQVTF